MPATGTESASLFDKLRGRLIEEGYAENPQPETKIVDLVMDSLDWAYLLVELEEVTGKEIPNDDFRNFRTLQDILNYAA